MSRPRISIVRGLTRWERSRQLSLMFGTTSIREIDDAKSTAADLDVEGALASDDRAAVPALQVEALCPGRAHGDRDGAERSLGDARCQSRDRERDQDSPHSHRTICSVRESSITYM